MRALVTPLFLSLLFALPAAARVDVGEEVPDLTVSEAGTGRVLRLAEDTEETRLTVVAFLAPDCKASNAYNEALNELARSLQEKGVRFVGITSGAHLPSTSVAAHAHHEGFVFPVAHDRDALVANVLGADEAPAFFVIDEDRTLVYRGRFDDGAGDPDAVTRPDLLRALDALLVYEPPAVAETEVHGCGIRH